LSALVYNPLFHEEESSSGNQVLDIQEYIVEQLNQHLHKQLIMHCKRLQNHGSQRGLCSENFKVIARVATMVEANSGA